MNENLYLRHWLAGGDFARDDELAIAMRNVTYAVGDRQSGDVVLVDPAYRTSELLDALASDGMTLRGVVATHYHPDHVGGEFFDVGRIEGVLELHAATGVTVHVQRDEVSWLLATTGLAPEAVTAHDDGDVLYVGSVTMSLVHTPGHTPGSQCVMVEGHLLSGDTLFIEGCGRTDLPGGDATALFYSLHERLGGVSDDVVLLPGHRYSPPSSMPMGDVRATNFVFRATTLAQWEAMFA